MNVNKSEKIEIRMEFSESLERLQGVLSLRSAYGESAGEGMRAEGISARGRRMLKEVWLAEAGRVASEMSRWGDARVDAMPATLTVSLRGGNLGAGVISRALAYCVETSVVASVTMQSGGRLEDSDLYSRDWALDSLLSLMAGHER